MKKNKKNKKKMNKKKRNNQLPNKPTSQLAGKPKNSYERRSQRYIEKKKNSQKVKKIPDKLTRYQLEEAKFKLEPLVSEANRRIEMIQSAGYTSYALDRVIHEGGGRDYFDLEDVKTREELVRESTRLRVFINDRGSSIDGAKLETAQIYADKYKGKFGNEYNNKENDFKRYDTSIIKGSIAEIAFRNYRILEEAKASLIPDELHGYGSENLINALYDAEIRGLDSQTYGADLLDTFERVKSKDGEDARQKANLISGITGIVEDNITGGVSILMNEWQGYKIGKVFTASQLAEFITNAFEEQEVMIVEKSKIEYFNIPASFDIETSSFYVTNSETGEQMKSATMYIWQLGINGAVIYGRTWDEFLTVLNELVDYLELSSRRRLILYVHNLGYEFQFIRHIFPWDNVFAIKQRQPVYAICGGLEFRCSYFLSNYALEYIGENLLHKYPIKKLVGDLDYKLHRHSQTPLTKEELGYCINDVRVVMSYIQEKIELDGDITQIPLTNTGYVRNYCRKECFYQGIPEDDLPARKRVQMNYKAVMKSLQVTSNEEYEQMVRAFMGGFTHAGALYSGKVMYDVGSADLASSYPFSMIAQYFPMTKGEYIGSVEDNDLFNHYLSKYCCLFDVEFTNLMPLVEFENVLSQSRCIIDGKYVVNNGRVVSADKCTTTLTELDYDTISKFYKWDSVKIMDMRIYHRGYLPKPLILAVLSLYKDKTELKGVEGKEIEYLVSKGMINASFGMMVTAIVRDEFEYNDEWTKKGANVDSQLAYYNRNFNRFLYYGWGVWVTAHARHNLFSAILEFADDYVYSDTDSIKGINFDDHAEYFNKYNDVVFEKLLDMCNHYNIPFSACKPKTKNGETKLIGVWEREESYKRFKTVGAKRYMYEFEDGTMSMTVSGLNKKFAMPYLMKENNNDKDLIFEKFGEGMFIPAGYTGKLTMTYIDEEVKGTLVDYLGNKAEYHELSSIHMEPQSYFMSLVGDYIKF